MNSIDKHDLNVQKILLLTVDAFVINLLDTGVVISVLFRANEISDFFQVLMKMRSDNETLI